MTQDEIIEMARQAGGQVTAWVNQSTIQKTTTFTFESPIDYYVSGEYPEKYHIKFLEAFAQLVHTRGYMDGWSKRTWVGLTEEDRAEILIRKWWDFEDEFDVDGFLRLAEAKLKEKNT